MRVYVGEVWGLAPALALGALTQIASGFLTLKSPVPQIVELPRAEFSMEETVLASPDIEIVPVVASADVG